MNDKATSSPEPGRRWWPRWIDGSISAVQLAFHLFVLGDLIYLVYNTAVVTLILGFIISYFASLSAHPLLFQLVAIILFLLTSFIFFFSLRLRRAKLGLEAELSKSGTSITELEGRIAGKTTIIDRLKFDQIEVLGRMVQLSRINAACDHRLFHLLHTRVLSREFKRGAGLSPEFIDSVQNIIIQNVIAVLDNACRVFNVYTRQECAASVKMPYRDSHDEMSSKALARDTHSSANRDGADDRDYRLADNTAFVEIWNKDQPFFVCNDLLTVSTQDKYRNPREDWHKDYNSTIVLPINYVGATNTEADAKDEGNKPVAFLCVDSMKGQFDEVFCVRYMRFLCWRLAVMIYRWNVLEALRKSQLQQEAG